MKLADFLNPYPDRTWRLASQSGITHAVAKLPYHDITVKPWSFNYLMDMKSRFEEYGFQLEVVEPAPPNNKIKLGLPGRDEEIEIMKELITNMGALEIPVLCYNFMAQFGWFRTDTRTLARGGALVSSYDHSVMQNAPLTEAGIITDEQLWDNYQYFIEQIVPVAEKAKVKLALHPDDPPISPVRGIARIFRNADAMQRAIDMVPSPYHGITLCQGNMAAAGENIPELIRRFSKQNKLFFSHFRDIRGTAEKFEETFHDCGITDMFEAMKTYVEVGFDGPLRADHVPTMDGETNDVPGYAVIGRLFAVGYIKGLYEGAQKTIAQRSSV